MNPDEQQRHTTKTDQLEARLETLERVVDALGTWLSTWTPAVVEQLTAAEARAAAAEARIAALETAAAAGQAAIARLEAPAPTLLERLAGVGR